MRVVSITLMSLLVLACSKKDKGAPAPSTGTAAAPKSHAPAAPGAGEPVQLTGKLLERIDAASYSYLRIQTPGGEVWAAVPETKLAVGADVQVLMPMLMQGFQSETLHRKFDRIYFGTLGLRPSGAGPCPGPGRGPLAPRRRGRSRHAAGRHGGGACAQGGGQKWPQHRGGLRAEAHAQGQAGRGARQGREVHGRRDAQELDPSARRFGQRRREGQRPHDHDR